MDPLRIVVAEDQPLLRAGIVHVLRDAGMDVVAQAGDAEDLLRKARAHRPDVVVTDVQMPPDETDDGLRAALTIRRELPGCAILVLSQFLDEHYALELLGDDPAGVGYLLKDRVHDIEAFVEAVRRVSRGRSVLDPDVVARMVGRRRRDDPLGALTEREREVLALMAEGLSNPGIAARLEVGVPAVEKHATGVFHKLGLGHDAEEHRRVKAVLAVLRASGPGLHPGPGPTVRGERQDRP